MCDYSYENKSCNLLQINYIRKMIYGVLKLEYLLRKQCVNTFNNILNQTAVYNYSAWPTVRAAVESDPFRTREQNCILGLFWNPILDIVSYISFHLLSWSSMQEAKLVCFALGVPTQHELVIDRHDMPCITYHSSLSLVTLAIFNVLKISKIIFRNCWINLFWSLFIQDTILPQVQYQESFSRSSEWILVYSR